MRIFMRTRGVLLATGAILLTLGVAAPPAAAAAPANDSFDGRVAVTVPSSTTMDTTEATTDQLDATLNQMCGAPYTDASVWFKVTVASDTDVTIDVSRSDYSAGYLVARHTARGWRVPSCNPDAGSWFARAGKSYAVMVFDDQADGVGNGGNLVMDLYTPTRRAMISVDVDPVAHFDPKTGVPAITVTVACEGRAAWAGLDFSMRQKAGRTWIQAYGGRNVGCTPEPRTLHLTASEVTGVFKGGAAEVTVYGYAYGTRRGSEVENTYTVRMHAS